MYKFNPIPKPTHRLTYLTDLRASGVVPGGLEDLPTIDLAVCLNGNVIDCRDGALRTDLRRVPQGWEIEQPSGHFSPLTADTEHLF